QPGAAKDLSAKARRIDPKDPHATALYLEALHRLGCRAEIDQLIRDEEWIRGDPECTFALGKIALEQEDFTRAESSFRASVRADPENFQAYEHLALAIIRPVQRALQTDPPLQIVGESAA